MRILLLFLFSLSLYAHQSSLAQMKVEVKGKTITGSWNIAVRDLELLVGMNQDFNEQITWSEVQNAKERIINEASANFLILQGVESCPLSFKALQIEKLNSNTYIHLPFSATCKQEIQSLHLMYTLLFENDSDHKCYVQIVSDNQSQTLLFSATKPSVELNLETYSILKRVYTYILEGIWHIWIGYDHILFLIALLLPAALLMTKEGWVKNHSFSQTFINVIKIVTAFTVAHSITLTLSSLDLIHVQSWLIESIIALSVIFAAINNIVPVIRKKIWLIVFIFGLIHGMGFASVLGELNLPQGSIFIPLLSFNIGVELGQLSIICVILPLIYVLSMRRFYIPLVLKLGSLSIALVGIFWLLERLGEATFIPT